MSDVVLSVSRLTKRYGGVTVVDRLDFQIRRGETLALLGPSGCGKSTTLRMIAGLETPDDGEIAILGRRVTSVPGGIFTAAEKRNVGLVFQSYAIWPHMSVEANVIYPLLVRKIPKPLALEQGHEILSVVGLAGFEKRPATQLSGGQQQRVALARSLVYKPDLLLLDEPLSNLDARLRDELRGEIRRIQRQLSLTVLYVTHDQIEAMALADRIAVMNQGRFAQVDAPVDIYDRPRSLFVQCFFGKAFLFEGVWQNSGAGGAIHLDAGPVISLSTRLAIADGARACVSVRSEDIAIAPEGGEMGSGYVSLPARIQDVRFLGNKLECAVYVGSNPLVLEIERSLEALPGQSISLQILSERLRVWPADEKRSGTLPPTGGTSALGDPPANAPAESQARGPEGEISEAEAVDRGRRKLLRRQKATLGGLALVVGVALFTLLPIAFVVVGSFNAADPASPWSWGLGAWAEAFRSWRTIESLGYSFLLTIRAPIAVVVGFVVAWLLVRVQIPGKSFIEFSLWVSYFLPALPVAIGWILLLHQDYGLINQALMLLPFVDRPLFHIYSVTGILWVHLSLTTIPVMTILLAPALRQLDASLEQSARVCGSGSLQTLRRILVPLLAPALLTSLLAGLIRGLEAFEIEQILGTPAGIYVYATRVYDLINFEPPLFPQAMALSTLLLGCLFVFAFFYQLYTERSSYATISGRGVTFGKIPTGHWRYVATAVCLIYIGTAIFLPLVVLIVGSFMRLFGFFSIPDPFTTDQWSRVFSDPAFGLALWNSFAVGLSVSGLGVVIYGLIAYVIVRSELPGRRLLSLLVWLPWSVPGILLGLALLWLILNLPVLNYLYGTLGALIVALLIQSMPIGTQMLRTSFAQVGAELEQASTVCGASWLTTYRKIMLPLIAPMLVSIFMLTFVTAIRDISTIVLVSGARTRPLSLLMMEFASVGTLEPAAVIGVILSAIAVAVALLARRLGLRVMHGGT